MFVSFSVLHLGSTKAYSSICNCFSGGWHGTDIATVGQPMTSAEFDPAPAGACLFFGLPNYQGPLPTSTPNSTNAMATLSRSLVSAVANRTYVNVPASAPALKKVLSVSAGSVSDSHHDEHHGKPLFGSSIKQRSAGGLVNRTSVNGNRCRKNCTTCMYFHDRLT